ncbi:hypothetical protein MTR_6g034200 [Medicago truncatula]|uniref:Uncharacterized protein n=1 Tax=Medicago truncatula TaxID=3880 RepID=A0A072UIY7_MEDTR|nr:hypothetical protein MTR_6g034200 [Medicago truncatula]
MVSTTLEPEASSSLSITKVYKNIEELELKQRFSPKQNISAAKGKQRGHHETYY